MFLTLILGLDSIKKAKAVRLRLYRRAVKALTRCQMSPIALWLSLFHPAVKYLIAGENIQVEKV